MRLVRRGLVLGALALGVTVGVAAPASAGSVIPDPVFKVSKTFNGGYQPGFIEANIGDGKTKDFFFRVKNPNAEAGVVVLRGAATNNGFKYRYFRGEKEITEKVSSGDQQLNLNGGQAKKVEMLVKKRESAPNKDCGFLRDDNPPHTEAGVAFNGQHCN